MRTEPAQLTAGSLREEAAAPAAVTLSWSDLGATLACAAVFTAWAARAGGGHVAGAAVAWLLLTVAFLAAGTASQAWRAVWRGIPPSLPLRLLVGFFLVNTPLMVLAWAAPGGLVAGFLCLVVLALLGLWRLRPRLVRPAPDELPGLVAIGIALAAATLWAQDGLAPPEAAGAVTRFKPWVDAFFHAAQIAGLSGAHGPGAIDDVQLAGVAARFYHYAPYATAALVKAISGLSAYAAFTGAMVPLGFFLTGLAAYALVDAWWGGWPAVGAVVAVLLVPDASHQLVRNPFFGYHWMQAVGPGGAYGVALLALAWTLLVRSCRDGSRWQLAAAWLAGGLALLYKAQLFVAAAFLLWMIPPLAFPRLRPRRRAEWTALALSLFALAVDLANRSRSFPGLRLDGSATRSFLSQMVLANTGPGLLRSVLAPHLGPRAPALELYGLGAVLVLACAVGLFAVAYAGLALALRGRAHPLVLAVPGLVMLSFLVLALGAAYGDRGVGTREELLHRPFVWAYFVTAAWCGGAACWLALRAARRPGRLQAALAIAAAVLLVVPGTLGQDLQDELSWSLANVRLPTGLVRAATWIRAHAEPEDVVQDARGDPWVAVAALSERRVFAVKYFIPTSYQAAEIERRTALVRRLLSVADGERLDAAASALGVRWLVVHPGDAVAWPPERAAAPAFEADGYRVYRLGGSG